MVEQPLGDPLRHRGPHHLSVAVPSNYAGRLGPDESSKVLESGPWDPES